ncbi:MAG: NAD(P)H-hydrate epimerase [Chloroflexota bacterium]
MTAPIRAARSAWLLPDLPHAAAHLPSVDRETMLEADRIATDQVGLGLLQLMENAGRELAGLTRRALGGSVTGRRVVVLAGTGNNAGGGLVAARRLAGWGADVYVAFARPILRLRPGPCAQLEPLLAAGVRTAVAAHDRSYPELAGEVLHADAVIDALIGYSLRGAPDEAHQPLIGIAALGDGPVISLDLPSGIDASTGARPGAAVTANITLALALPKRGTETGDGRRLSGARYVADIGIPRSVFVGLGIEGVPSFANGPLLRID